MILKHLLSGNIGKFLCEYKPTGHCLTTQIKLETGKIYFAPSHEFIKL